VARSADENLLSETGTTAVAGYEGGLRRLRMNYTVKDGIFTCNLPGGEAIFSVIASGGDSKTDPRENRAALRGRDMTAAPADGGGDEKFCCDSGR
jgi:hypothetical protein